jgi:hypothetical protein
LGSKKPAYEYPVDSFSPILAGLVSEIEAEIKPDLASPIQICQTFQDCAIFRLNIDRMIF